MTQAWRAQAERGSPRALALITFIGNRIGRGAARALLWPIALYFVLTGGRVRRASRAYLRRVLEREPRLADVFRHVLAFSATILDRVFLLTGRFERFEITVHDGQIILDQVGSGQGALLMSAHLGSFEVLRAVAILERELPVRVLMNVDHNSAMTRFTNALNPRMSETIIPIHDAGTLLAVKEHLDEGCLVGVLGDRVVRDDQAVMCDFLGAPAAFPAGPMRMAAALGCRVILAFGLYRGGNRYDVHFEVLSEGLPKAARRGVEGIRAPLQAYADRLAWYARLAPYNWFNFFDFWADGGGRGKPA